MKAFLLFAAPLLILAASLTNGCRGNAGKPDIQHDTVKSDNKMFSKTDSIITNGEYIRYYKNGVIQMRGMMKNGKRDGLWKSWYDNGLPWSETVFRDGLKDGMTTTWYENNNKRYQGFYSKDKEAGKWTFFAEDGHVLGTRDYDTDGK